MIYVAEQLFDFREAFHARAVALEMWQADIIPFATLLAVIRGAPHRACLVGAHRGGAEGDRVGTGRPQ